MPNNCAVQKHKNNAVNKTLHGECRMKNFSVSYNLFRINEEYIKIYDSIVKKYCLAVKQ